MGHEEGGFGVGSVLLSFILGGVIGAGLALLLAPQSGVETRRRLRELTDDVKERASEYIGQAKEKVASSLEKGKHIVEEKKSAISAAIEAGKKAYEEEVHK